MVAIYERIGRPVNKLVMRYCCMRGLAALKSGLALGKTLFEQYAAESPMLLEEIDGYYLGGMDEMTARTVNCWANLTRWFSDGIDAGDKLRGGWNICDVFQAIRARGGADRHGGGQNGAKLEDWTDPAYHWSSDYHHHGIDQVHWRSTLAGVKEVDVITNDFGAETYILRKGIPKFEVAPPQVASASRALGFSDPIYVATYVPYGHLGASVSAGYFHTDPNELAFAVGAPWESEDSSRPGEGNVYIIPNSFISQEQTFFQPTGLKNYTRESGSSADPSARHSPDQRFGTASTSLKTLNRTFLAVSAPGPLTYDSGSSPSLPFHEKALAGRVDLFVPGQAKPEFTFSMRGAELGSLGRRQWGDAVTSAALDPESEDEFLVVSGSRTDGERICNGRQKHQYGEGEVTVLRLRPLPQNSKLPRTVEDPFLIVDQTRANCTATGSWGHIASCNPWENGAAAAAGVYTEAFQLLLPESEKQAIDCDDQNTYARYGAATAFSKSAKILWVSAPGLGKVYGYRMAPGQPGMQLVVVIKDEDFLQRLRRTGFGHALATGVWDGQEWVAVAAPNEDAEKARQVGMVRIYRILNNGGEAKLWAEVVPATPMPFTKFGRSLAVDDAEGVLWVGSEFAAEERGAVWEVRIGRLPLREERGCVWWCTKVARKVMIEAGLVGKEVGEESA